MSVWRKASILIVITLALDVSLAQVVKRLLVNWHVTTPSNFPRAPSPDYHHGLRPMMDVTNREHNRRYRLATNSLSMVDATPRVIDPRAGGCRVLLIGDSFTEGYGVAWEETFAGRLAEHWRRDGIELLNAGVSGYSPSIYYRKVRHLMEVRDLRFDALLVAIDISDIRDEWVNYDIDDDSRVVQISKDFATTFMREPRLFHEILFAVVDNSFIANTMYRNLWRFGWHPTYQVKHRPDAPPIEPRSHSPPKPPPLGSVSVRLKHHGPIKRTPVPFVNEYGYWSLDPMDWQDFGRDGLQVAAERMDRLVILLRKHGIPLTISVHPWQTNLAAGDLYSVQVRFWNEWARTREVGFINLFPAFFSAGPDVVTSHFLSDGDVHWNERGHALVADEILRTYDPRAACRAQQTGRAAHLAP